MNEKKNLQPKKQSINHRWDPILCDSIFHSATGGQSFVMNTYLHEGVAQTRLLNTFTQVTQTPYSFVTRVFRQFKPVGCTTEIWHIVNDDDLHFPANSWKM